MYAFVFSHTIVDIIFLLITSCSFILQLATICVDRSDPQPTWVVKGAMV